NSEQHGHGMAQDHLCLSRDHGQALATRGITTLDPRRCCNLLQWLRLGNSFAKTTLRAKGPHGVGRHPHPRLLRSHPQAVLVTLKIKPQPKKDSPCKAQRPAISPCCGDFTWPTS